MTELPQVIKGPHKEKPYRLVIHGWSMDLTEAEISAIVRQVNRIRKCEPCQGSGLNYSGDWNTTTACSECAGTGRKPSWVT